MSNVSNSIDPNRKDFSFTLTFLFFKTIEGSKKASLAKTTEFIQSPVVSMAANTTSLLSSLVNKFNMKTRRSTLETSLSAPSSLRVTSNHDISTLADQLSGW